MSIIIISDWSHISCGFPYEFLRFILSLVCHKRIILEAPFRNAISNSKIYT
jgi:hypothetical protein